MYCYCAKEQPALPPHVLIFPFQIQGHVNSMLNLANILCHAGLHITFLLSGNAYSRLLRYSNVQTRLHPGVGFRFQVIPNTDNLRPSGDGLMTMFHSLYASGKPFLREFLSSSNKHGDHWGPVTCIIADGVLGLALEVAEELAIPIIYFRTISGCSFWAYFCIPDLIDAGEIPFNGNDMDKFIQNVPSMENFIRYRDLPSFCRASNLDEPDIQMVLNETRKTPQARALILNTFEDLEGPVISQIRTQCPKVYNVGPLHAHLKTRLAASSSTSSNSLWEEDRSCMTWLDNQPLKSVLYVSFGSFTIVTKDQLNEFWHGLIKSGQRFLWVIRPGSIVGKDTDQQIPVEMVEGTEDRKGYLVDWAPQEEVLAHPAVGGFMTHSGWNSTLEAIVEGVPMICWPYFADQQLNSRYVGEVWKLGIDMKDTCDRNIVAKMVRDLMEMRKEEFLRTAQHMAELAKKAISQGGSSYRELEQLIEDIRLMA